MNKERAAVLAIDLGTGGPKVALVRLDGVVVDHEHRRTEPRVGLDGSAVQDPMDWWRGVVSGTQALMERRAGDPSDIVAVGLTGQWGSTVPCDRAGVPVGDCILWLDRRGRHLAGALLGDGRITIEGFTPRKVLQWIRLAGGAPSTEGNDPLGQRLLIREELPEVHAATEVYLEPLDWLIAQLTGKVAATQLSMLLSWLTDNRRLDVTEYDSRLVELAGVDPSRLPPLVPIRRPVGSILPEIAEELGLPTGIPVMTALPDLHTATLGSGAVDDLHGHLTISSTAWVGCHTAKKKTSINYQMATVPAALPGRYVLANNHETAGLCLEWLRSGIIAPDDGLSRKATVSFEDLTVVADGVPSGSNGVLFTPWLNGERSPVSDSDLRGSFLNLSMSTTRADLVRALLEGVALNARWLLEVSEKVVGGPLRDLRILGGGASSDTWCQIHADVLGRPVTRPVDPLLVGVRGAALFAGVVLGHIRVDELGDTVPMERTFEPAPEAREVQDHHYEVFTGIYKSQRRLYRRLNGG